MTLTVGLDPDTVTRALFDVDEVCCRCGGMPHLDEGAGHQYVARGIVTLLAVAQLRRGEPPAQVLELIRSLTA